MSNGDSSAERGSVEPALTADELRDAYEQAPCGFLTSSQDGRLVGVNQTFCQMTGWSREQVLGCRSLLDLLTPGSRLFWQSWHATLPHLDGQLRGVAVDLRTADGSDLPVLLATSPVPARPGAAPLVRTSVLDASDRRTYERELILARRRAEVAESRSAAIVRSALDAVVVLAPDGQVVEWNATAERLFGRARAEAVGMPAATLLCRPLLELAESAPGDGTGEGAGWRRQAMLATADGAPLPAEVSLTRAYVDGRALTVLSVRDLRAETTLRDELDRSRSTLQAVLADAPVLVLGLDADGTVTMAEGNGAAAFGRAWEGAVGRPVEELLSHRPALLADCRRALAGETLVATHPTGGRAWETSFRPHRDERGEAVGGVTVVAFDVTEHLALATRLERLARHDPLTGLANRSAFQEELALALAEERDGVAVLYLDLDDFKDVNDSYGHALGDEVLVEVAGRLRAAVPAGSVLARHGGDEFVVLLRGPAAHSAAAVGRRMVRSLVQPVAPQGCSAPLSVRASVGVSVLGGDADDATTLLAHADAAMYRAKRLGRNPVAVFTPAHDDPSVRVATTARLRHAVECGLVVPHYQPVVSLTDGRLVGVEALARWTDEELGPVPPATFVPLAEAGRLIVELGELVLDQALGQLAQWTAAGVEVPSVAVNVSPHQLRYGRFPDLLDAALRRHGVAADAVVVELTETVVVEAAGDELAAIAAVRELGCRVAVDDFGTGHSSLARLRDLPVDVVKLDRAFVAPLPEARADALVAAFLRLADALGLSTVAEGVENEAQRAHLAEAGCAAAQGYLLGAPVPAADLTPVLERGPQPFPAWAGRVTGLR
ncbi:MAG TPA: EAL domain-containing protein [Motilibacteraceae bacterium]|nr:EAL domain-containing protein [Motilibacteraceae bacterium]